MVRHWKGTPARQLSAPSGMVVVAVAFIIGMALCTLPTPLYGLYAHQDRLTTFGITVVFAAFALGVTVSLFLLGHVSDWAGRRRVLVLGLAVELGSCVVFLVWNDLPGLMVARFATGIGAGLVTATATVYLGELNKRARATSDIAAISTLSNIGGLALGPLIGGVFAQFAPDPLELPFLLFLVLLSAAAMTVSKVPETAQSSQAHQVFRPQRLVVPSHGRGAYAAAALAAGAAFAVFGLFSSLVTTVLTKVLDDSSALVAGLASSTVFASATLVQLTTTKLSPRMESLLAAALTILGLGMLVISVLTGSLSVFLVSAVLAGGGVGILFRTSLKVAGTLATPETSGEVLAGIFLAAYLGVAVPVLLLGITLTTEPLQLMVIIFASAISALIALVTPALLARSRRVNH